MANRLTDILNPLQSSSLLVRAQVIPFITENNEYIKAGERRKIEYTTETVFRPSHIIGTPIIAKRFHFISLQIGNQLSAILSSKDPNFAVVKWHIDNPTTLLPGTKLELFIMNISKKERCFAASLIGYTHD
jgi:hypothetical protein